MIDREKLQSFIEEQLAGTGYFLTDLEISADNDIRVEIDSLSGVDIDECIKLNRAIEEAFDRDEEDYSLEVGSAGLTSPLRVPAQYEKYRGKRVEVLTKDGRKLKGELVGNDSEGFTLRVAEKVKKEGQKRPVEEEKDLQFSYDSVKYTKYLLEF